MDEIFRRILSNNFADLSGLVLAASIPVPEDLINEMIAVTLKGNRNISYCRVSISPQNRISVDLKTPLLPLTLNLKLRLAESVDLSGSPKIRAWLENNALLGKLGSFFDIFPAGIRMYGNQIVIDIGSFLQSPEQKRLVGLIKDVAIQTIEGKVIVAIKIEASEVKS
jgi:hypothetical protein